MNVPVMWVNYETGSPARGYWDQAVVEDLLSGEMWQPVNGHQFVMENEWSHDMADGGVVVVAGRQNATYVDRLNADLSKLAWCVVMITGDEEHTFPIDKLDHPRMVVYEMTPRPGSTADRYLPNGYAQPMRGLLGSLNKEAAARDLDWFFAGQVTHSRRKACVDQLDALGGDNQDAAAVLVKTEGFTQGIPPKEYYRLMVSAKVAPCPSGPETPDTFRLYEALEAGCLPIVDNRTPRDDDPDYWHRLLGDDLPFPLVDDWAELPGLIEYHRDVWPSTANRASAWWQGYKRQLAYQLHEDITRLAGTDARTAPTKLRDRLTVLIPTSPIPSHPSTAIIEETVKSVREHLPDAEIIIMMDGVREEQADRRQDYEEYQRRLLWLCNHEWSNVLPLRFEEHHHQAGMTREALEHVRTPLVMFVEHDMPLMDRPIDWQGITGLILSDQLDAIRFQLDAEIPPVHNYLMLDKEPVELEGVPLVRTAQWSQRVHIMKASTYRAWLDQYISCGTRTMIEGPFHGHIHSQWINEGKPAWHRHRLAIYAPEKDMRRAYHLDGRADDPKWEDD